MNPGLPEEAGLTARSVTDALKSTPVVLALVIFNVLFMFLITYASIRQDQSNDSELARMHELIATTLRTCVPSSKQSD